MSLEQLDQPSQPNEARSQAKRNPAPVQRSASGGWINSKVMTVGFGIGIVVSLGAGIWLSQASGNQQTSDSSGSAVAAQQETGVAKPVTVAPAQPAQIRQFLSATGTVEARELVPVKSQASGLQVLRVLVDEGQLVQANQPMAILDDSVLRTQLVQARASMMEAEAALAELRRGNRPEVIARAREGVKQAAARVEQAKADVQLAEQRFKRNKELYDGGAISEDRLSEIITQARSAGAAQIQAESSFEEAKDRLEELQRGARQEDIVQAQARLFRAQGQVREWEARITQARVVASATGVVAERRVKVGELVSNENELFSIIEGGVVELYLTVPETEVRRIRPGLPVRVTSDADSDLKLVGQVREIDPIIDADSRQATVKVALRSPQGLRKGMFLRGEVATALAQGLAIPTAAVLPQGDGSSIVYRVKPDRTVEAVSVQTGEVLPGNWIEIKDGLKPGEAVVVKGAPYLKDGDRVQVAGTVSPPTQQQPQSPNQSAPNQPSSSAAPRSPATGAPSTPPS